MNKLSENDIVEKLSEIQEWKIENKKLYVEYKFKDYVSAFEFMTKLSKTINKLDHHPDWTNSYNKITISLFTHSANGITDLDFELARVASELYKDTDS